MGPDTMATVLCARTAAHPQPTTPGEEDRAPAVGAAPVTDGHRRPHGDAGLDGARGAGARPVAPACARRIRTGEPARRYEHPHPGMVVHVDVKKLGNISDGDAWRFVGRAQGGKNRSASTTRGTNSRYQPLLGTGFVHTVIDDHSRVAYAEIYADEKAATAIAVLARAVSWFAARGVRVERVLSDNWSAYKSHAWRDACANLGLIAKKTRRYRPQANGRIERFHRTLAAAWAFARHYRSETTRRAALPGWLYI